MIDKIYDLLENMEEELEDAEKYAVHAVECARHHSPHKNTYISLAEDELKHFEKLSEMLKAHTDIGEELKHYVSRKHTEMLKEHGNIRFLLAEAQG